MKSLEILKIGLFAHRGIYDNKRIYENTIGAFNRALKYSYPIELDVRLLSDGNVVVFHDESLERMLHVEEKIEDMTLQDLTYYAKFQIPTLEQVLEAVNGTVPLLIELKSKKIVNHTLENNVINILKNYNGKYAFQSFNKHVVKYLYKKCNNVPVGLLSSNKKDNITGFKYCDFFNVNVKKYDNKEVHILKSKKIVLGYNIDTEEKLLENRLVYDNLVCDNLLEIKNK